MNLRSAPTSTNTKLTVSTADLCDATWGNVNTLPLTYSYPLSLLLVCLLGLAHSGWCESCQLNSSAD